MRNIRNHLDAVGGKNIDLRVVLQGKELSLLLEPDMAEETRLARGNATEEMEAKIAVLKGRGVQFKVCANTFKGKRVDYRSHLYDVSTEDIVPSGVAELARLQGMGYAYIKP